MKRVMIVAARRTPFGRMGGPLASVTPLVMASTAAGAALGSITPEAVDLTVLGNVYSAGHGMNLARQVAVQVGVPLTAPAYTVNLMCGSGMHAVALGAQAIRTGEAKVALVGGVESMSLAPFALPRPPKGQPLNPESALDTLPHDGLLDSFSHQHMGQTAETLAREFQLTRVEQDAFAVRSQLLYAAAHLRGDFHDELVLLSGMTQDEPPRPNVSQLTLANLHPVFDSAGTVTAGNSSGLANGASMLVLAEEQHARQQGWPILAEWTDCVTVGCDPQRMGLGPVHAIRELFRRQGISWCDIGTLEINEAFASQVLACLGELDLSLDLNDPLNPLVRSKASSHSFNASGGAIAMGHPLAASGARLLVHLAWTISRGEARNSLAALCIGGGMGIASLLTAASESTIS